MPQATESQLSGCATDRDDQIVSLHPDPRATRPMIRWDQRDPEFLTDAELRAEYLAGDGVPGAPRCDALAAELKRRNVDL